jgi:hypothetical protein
MLDSANNCIHLQLIGSVVSFRATEGPAEEPDRMLKPTLLEILYQHSAEGNATRLRLENETVFRIRHAHLAGLEQLSLE